MSLLLAEAAAHGLRTIAFCKSRKLCELVAAYARESLRAAAPQRAHMVKVCVGEEEEDKGGKGRCAWVFGVDGREG